jgi:hypothetical protein
VRIVFSSTAFPPSGLLAQNDFRLAHDPPGIGDKLQTQYLASQATHLLLSQRKCDIFPFLLVTKMAVL